MDKLLQDVRYAARVLLKSPVFTTVAVLSLAVGIGANTAIFSVIDAALVRQLPVEAPEELVLSNLTGGVYFDALGLGPPLGRLLTAEDDEAGAEPVVVLSHGYWQRRLGGNPQVLGQPVGINGEAYTIVGVTPRGFEGTLQIGSRPSVYIPLAHVDRVAGSTGALTSERYWWVQVMGRLAPGVTPEQAQSAMQWRARSTWPGRSPARCG